MSQQPDLWTIPLPSTTDVAFEGGDGDAEFVQKTADRNAAVGSKQLVDVIKKLGLVHVRSRYSAILPMQQVLRSRWRFSA